MSVAGTDEVLNAFKNASNPNAALKNFLKREVNGNKQLERFIKDLRSAVSLKSDDSLKKFIEKNLEEKREFFLSAVRYSYQVEMAELISKIIEGYADSFNATYERQNGTLVINNSAEFERIVREVERDSLASFEKWGVPENKFMMEAVVTAIFDEDVLEKVRPIVGLLN